MDYSAVKYSNRNGINPSFIYNQRRCFWFNSCYNDDFQFADVVNNYYIDSITFYVPSFELFKCAKMKVISYIKDVTSANQIIIKLISPYMKFDEITNSDKEGYKMIYINNTGVEGMMGETIPVILQPQQINKFVFKFETVVARYSPSVSINYISNGNASITTSTNGYFQFGAIGTYYRLPIGTTSFTYVNGMLTIKTPTYSQIMNEYQNIKNIATGVITYPISHYRFDDASDLGKDHYNRYNLTKAGAPSYDPSLFIKGSGSVKSTTGNNYYQSTSFYNITGNSFSISLWSRRSAITNSYSILFKLGSSTTAGAYMMLRYTTSDFLQITNGTTAITGSSYYPDLNQWKHIVFTFDSASRGISVYANNFLDISGNFFSSYSGNATFTIMSDGNANFYRGNFDDVRFYDRVLTATEVSELYYGTVAIYTIPRFLLGIEVEDIDLEVDNGVSEYK